MFKKKSYMHMNNFENFETQRYDSFRKKMRIGFLLLFFFIIGILFYSAFYDGNIAIGNVIDLGENIGDENKISFKSELDVPEFSFKQEIEKIEINSINGGGDLSVGGEKFSLNKINQNYIVLNDFEGNFFLDDNKITILNGKAKNVILNGFNISTDSGRRNRLELFDELSYSSISINGIFINELNYISSGKIRISNENSLINLNDNEVIFNSFNGNLNIYNNKLLLDGNAEKIRIIGNNEISIK